MTGKTVLKRYMWNKMQPDEDFPDKPRVERQITM